VVCHFFFLLLELHWICLWRPKCNCPRTLDSERYFIYRKKRSVWSKRAEHDTSSREGLL